MKPLAHISQRSSSLQGYVYIDPEQGPRCSHKPYDKMHRDGQETASYLQVSNYERERRSGSEYIRITICDLPNMYLTSPE